MDLKVTLANVLWIGGATDSGKTSVARALAEKYGWQQYHLDRYDREVAPGHWARINPVRQPHMTAHIAKSMDDRWVNTSPAEMLGRWLEIARERFEMVLEDLGGLPATPMVVAEGYGLLPELVAPLISSTHQAIWLVSNEAFKRETYLRRVERGEKGAHQPERSDPERARENHIGRDLLIGEYVRERAEALGLRVVTIDGGRTLEEVVSLVDAHFGGRTHPEGAAG